MPAKKKADFVIIGSGGGGGTIAWMLAKAGHSVVLLEQGGDLRERLDEVSPRPGSDPKNFNSVVHDEHFFRVKRPDPKRRPRGDYNTFRRHGGETARPFKNGWTGSSLGGGSVVWGTWAYRALPVDFKLETHYKRTKQFADLKNDGYSVADWPVAFREFAPFYNVAEALLAVNGDRRGMTESIRGSAWFQAFADQDYFGAAELLEPQMDYPGPPYPRTPVGQFVADALDAAGMKACALPTAIVSPGTPPYKTREALARSLATLDGADTHQLWKLKADELWSKRVRDACNMCGFCGEYICWGKDGPKSGTHITTLREMESLKTAEIILHAKAIEVLHDDKTKRATGVRYLDISKPDAPKLREVAAHHVIVSCGAVQSARLLLMSGPPAGLGQNEAGDLGGNATFHLFGFGAKAVLAPEFQGFAHGEFGPTGNTTSFGSYFFQNPVNKQWIKVGTLTSTAKKNPMETAVDAVELKGRVGRDLIREMEIHARTLEIRCTADDLPMRRNRVELDPLYVDEYGLPVARITRDLGSNEWQMYGVMEPELNRILEAPRKAGILESVRVSPAIVSLIGDHQMGTCRMSADAKNGVVDKWCRLHTTPNVFVVDSSFMPTGLGLNPMLTVMANALRVGSWMIDTLAKGGDITKT